jgi:Phage tail assembly chaperone proteins, E, or 41 or 14
MGPVPKVTPLPAAAPAALLTDEQRAVLEQVAAYKASFPQTFPLTQAIDAHGERRQTLTLRAPRAGDVALAGSPIRSDGELDETRLVPLVARLADIPESSVKQLDIGDLLAIGQLLRLFFLPSARILLSASSMLPGFSGPSST